MWKVAVMINTNNVKATVNANLKELEYCPFRITMLHIKQIMGKFYFGGIINDGVRVRYETFEGECYDEAMLVSVIIDHIITFC